LNLSDQPVQELLELVRSHKLSPWDVDISKLILIYKEKMKRSVDVDLRVPSRVMHSSATLLKLKSEIAVRGESKVTEEEMEEMLRIDLLPDMGELTLELAVPDKITLQELLSHLREALASIPERREREKPAREKLVVDVQRDIDAMFTKWMEEVLARIGRMIQEGKTPTFFSLLSGRSRTEFVRVFITLIFLYSDGKVRLEQPEPFSDIRIELLGGREDGNKGGPDGS